MAFPGNEKIVNCKSQIERNSSFELLRLILMVLIVIHHCIVHGLGIDSIGDSAKNTIVLASSQTFLAFIINAFCICAVNCFVLISGFFGIRTNKKKFVFLLLSLAFYTVLLQTIPYFFKREYVSGVLSLLFLSHSCYWFVICYLMLMLFTPILNMAFDKLSPRNMNIFIIGLCVINCYFGFLWSHSVNLNGYTLMQFILMYCIGRKLKEVDLKINRIVSSSMYIVSSLLCGMSMWLLWKTGRGDLAWRCTYYNNPLIIISAIGLFLFFRSIRLESKFINRVAVSAFGIYLIQSSVPVSDWLYGNIRQEYLLNNWGGGIYLYIAIISIAISMGSLIVDKLRLTIINKICRRF